MPGGDGDGQKVPNDKGGKAASPFEGGEKSVVGPDPNDVQSNGIMQNGQDDKLYRYTPYEGPKVTQQNSRKLGGIRLLQKFEGSHSGF